jgi:hypothetical protein
VIKGAFYVVQAFMKTVRARNIQYVYGEKTTLRNHAELSFVLLLNIKWTLLVNMIV